MPGVGVNVSPFRKRERSFQFSDVADKLLILANNIAGSNGDHLATITDASPAGVNFTQGTDANRPTLSTSWAGSRAIASSGTQRSTASSGVVSGLSSFTVCWWGECTDASTFRVPWFFGDNDIGNGFDLDVRRSGAAFWNIYVASVESVTTNLAADTGIHFVSISYDGAGGATKWEMSRDGVAVSLANADAMMISPGATSTLFATRPDGTFGFPGFTGGLLVSGVRLSAMVIARVRAKAKTIWTGLP